jgi:hypothetical protein
VAAADRPHDGKIRAGPAYRQAPVAARFSGVPSVGRGAASRQNDNNNNNILYGTRPIFEYSAAKPTMAAIW